MIEEPVIYVNNLGELISKVSAEQVEAVLGPHVDRIRAGMYLQERASKQSHESEPLLSDSIYTFLRHNFQQHDKRDKSDVALGPAYLPSMWVGTRQLSDKLAKWLKSRIVEMGP